MEDRRPPCRLLFHDTGVTLGNPPEGGVAPDPMWVAYGPDGRYYTGGTSAVGIWSADGRALATLGGPGEGPGEFNPGAPVVPLVGRDGTVHVFSYRGWWHRFDSAGVFLGRGRSPHLAAWPALFALTKTGLVVHGQRAAGSPSEFHVVAPDGSLVAEWGRLPELPPESERRPAPVRYRVVASTSSGTFWAAPHKGSPVGYQLEEWSYDGELRRRLVRDPEWFPEIDPDAPFPEVQPPFISVHVDSEGLLMTSIRPDGGQPIEYHYEVIDPDEVALLASERVLFEEGDQPFVFFPGYRRAFQMQVDALGLTSFRIYDYELVPAVEEEGAGAICR